MLTTGRQASRTRWLGAALALALAALGLISFYRYGSSPTDENLFSRPTSPAMLPQAIAGDGDETLHAGDLLLRVGERRIDVVADVTRALDAASDDTVEVLALRPATLERFVIPVPTAELREAAVRDVGQAALVHTLVPNGASDRAGMQIGDLIVRINGQSFHNIYEADAIMRSGIAGRVTEYQVIRQGVPRTLYVTLAAFGVALAPLLALLTGFAWLLLGAALMLLRPGIAAARDLGLALILLGYAIMVGYIPRHLPQGGMEHLRDLVMIAAASLGLALWVQAVVSFPRERPALRERRWLVPGAYVLGAVGGIAVYLNRAPIVGIVAFLAMVVYAWAGTWLGKDRCPPDESKVRLPLRIATWTAIAAALAGMALTTLPGVVNNGFVSVGFLGVPLAIIYTIGRYRLLDLDLRVRRSVQYFFASAAWIGALVIALLWLLTVLPNVDLPLPHLRMSRASVELLDQPMTDDERAPLEKAALMVVAIGLAFVAQRVGRRGLEWIASRFHRPTHDYRRASRDLATLVGSRLDLEGLADGLIDTTVGLLPVKRAGVMFIHGPTTYWGRNAHGFPGRHWEELCGSAADIVQGIGKATAEVNAQYAFPRLRRALEAADVLHLYPIRSHDKLVGALLVGDKLSEAAFSADDFEFLGAIAQQIAPAVDNAFLYEELAEQERLKHELEIARRIQLESLPQFTPLIEGLDVSGVSVPAFEVGGDYFDYLNGAPKRFTVMVGDVSGKGTSAALYMSKLQGILRSLHGFNLTPHELFVRTNHLLCQDLERRSFVTALGGFFDTGADRVVLARAGHLPLYHFDASRAEVHRLLPRGLGFGLSQRAIFSDELEEREIGYGIGDVFLFITDGITESQSADGEEFGEERVVSLLETLGTTAVGASGIRDRLMSAVREFSGAVEQADDQTVVVVRAITAH